MKDLILYSSSPRFDFQPKHFMYTDQDIKNAKAGRIGALISGGLDMDIVRGLLSNRNRNIINAL